MVDSVVIERVLAGAMVRQGVGGRCWCVRVCVCVDGQYSGEIKRQHKRGDDGVAILISRSRILACSSA